jgi:RND family efflux transporter MFP subunit
MPIEKGTLDDLRIDRREEPAPGGRRRGLLVAGVALAAALAAGGWWLAAARPVEVEVATAVEAAPAGGARAVLNASGYVTARRQATVSSKITGKVVEVLVEEGMAVAEEQVLARLDDATPRRVLALAEAQLRAARGALRETEVRLAEARLALRRAGELSAGGVASQADLDAAQAEVDSLQARLAAQREEAEVAERQLALRRQDLDDTVIRAPFAGVAISKDAQPGEMISPVSAGGGFTRTGICTLVDMSSLEIEVDVNEAYINRVRPGQQVEAVLDAYPEWRIPAHVIITVPAADRQKATVKVRIGFVELDPRLLPDMGVKVGFLEDAATAAAQPRRAVRVPRAALRQEDGGQHVWVVAGGRLERRAVVPGLETGAAGDEIEVAGDLAAGEQVVIAGPADLRPGMRVETKE